MSEKMPERVRISRTGDELVINSPLRLLVNLPDCDYDMAEYLRADVAEARIAAWRSLASRMKVNIESHRWPPSTTANEIIDAYDRLLASEKGEG